MTIENLVSEIEITLRPHRRKTIAFLELWHEGGLRTKLYGIYGADMEIGDRLKEIAKDLARRTLPRPAVACDRYGLAFVTIHES